MSARSEQTPGRGDAGFDKVYYYSFKIFPRFGLVETTRIIHHNQLLFTKFGKNLRHIQSMTSKARNVIMAARPYANRESRIYSQIFRNNILSDQKYQI